MFKADLFAVTSGQFVGQNIHFAIYLFAALACFAAGWLYLDAWSGRRSRIDLPKWTGFFLLAIGFLVEGAVWKDHTLDAVASILQLLGYAGLVVGNFLEPIQPRPKYESEESKEEKEEKATPENAAIPKKVIPQTITPPRAVTVVATPVAVPVIAAPANPPSTSSTPTSPAPADATPAATTPVNPVQKTTPIAFITSAASGLTIALPFASAAVAVLYWRRATVGLERHLKPIAGVFAALSLANIFGLAKLWRDSDNPLVQQIAGPLGPAWIMEHIFMVAGSVWLVWWVWRYLTKRFLTQFFLTMTTFTVTIVLVATVSITSLLLSSLQKDALTSLETAAKVLDYAVSAQTSNTRANATILAQTPAATTATTTGNHAAAAKLVTDLLVKQHLSDVVLTSDTGQVIARASDPDRYGDSISDDSLVRRALIGTTATTTTQRSGVLAPELIITTAAPIRDTGNRIVGVALASLSLDNTFVDGIKHTTGLDSAVYAGDVRSATTLVGADGISRSIGAKETSKAVKDSALTHGQIWRGPLSVGNIAYLGVYLPLKDVDNTVVGMLFVGQVQDTVLQSAGQAIRLTFGLAVLWLLIIMFPIYLIARLIAKQMR